ncbi:hypothetical protein PR202_ga17810 [Eleusine coracana subsp. coracana]|uniref:Uncharacterized protein n=1 Tax=Eleusine coracana subsp. coracana TaxID=191504 RepID=A0AAV5CRI6_ELECO|nr:hypothetical protein PR202_ga17810 [Eleusine coracana subsp. coracana]
MDLDMDPYEEAEAAAEAAGLGGPAAEDSDEDDSEAESVGDMPKRQYGFDPYKKQGYKLKDLLQHADGIGASSKHRRHGRERASHCAFARFVRTDPSFAQELAGITGIAGSIAPAPATNNANGSASAHGTAEADVVTAGSNIAAAAVAPPPEEVEKYVFPWACVLAAGSAFNPEEFASRVVTFSFVEVVPLFMDEMQGSETFAIVMFKNDWSGFNDALTLDNHFSLNKLGKNEWDTRNNGGDSAKWDSGKDEVKVYGWIAQDGDYNASSVVGSFLRKHTNLKTINDASKIGSGRSGETVAALASQIDENRSLQNLESKKNATELSITRLQEENRKQYEAYNEGMRNIHRKAHENALRIFRDNENLRNELQNRRRELNSRAKQFEKLSAENARDKKKLDDERQKAKGDNSELELTSIEQQRTDEDVHKLLDDQKREKEDAHARMLQLEKERHEKQQLELEEVINDDDERLKHLRIRYGDDVCNAVKTALTEINEYNPSGRYLEPEL